MDNLCHTLAGVALADAGLKRRTALGMATLVIASNLPDVDVAVFATDTLAMSFRRGWTHGVLAMAVMPAVLAVGMVAWDRFVGRRWSRAGRPPIRLRQGRVEPAEASAEAGAPAKAEDPPLPGRPAASLGGLLLLAYIGVCLHVFMDFLNTYGVRLLMPFSNRWFYGDALYIVDPWMYLALGGAIAVGRFRRRRGAGDPSRPARVGLTIAGAYVVVMLGTNLWARAVVRDGLVRAYRPADTRFMVTPVVLNPFRREVIVEIGDRYEKGFLWFEPAPHFRPAGYGVDTNRSDPAAVRAAETPRFQAYLRWSRFPFFVIDRTVDPPRVFLNDYRYSGPSGRDGWAGVVVALR